MQTDTSIDDCAIIGGGLSGLCLAIQLADQGWQVTVFEKNEFPLHKVCGEYISMESHDFLIRLGLPLKEWDLPYITQLGISSEQGFMLDAPLDLGGFGISRYTLDHELYVLALTKGVRVLQQCKVQNIHYLEAEAVSAIETTKGNYRAKLVCGSYGKYTPAFIQEHKEYTAEKNSKNYIGVKYHIKTNLPHNRIELHNFSDGYCGISKVDKDWYCLCYLSSAENLRRNGNSIEKMEEQVLYRNPFLKRYFNTSEFVSRQPLVISNVQFSKKQVYSNHVFFLGDAAGSISPLCGNGMSMGMRASVLLATAINAYLHKQITKQELIARYTAAWSSAFNTRIKTGYYLQNLFGKKTSTQLALKTLSLFPALTKKIISLTHGTPF
jgi:2-polyprenyl-6-methoxyphenol hydroxylase-like FAD-dependent oxidoreductase